MRFFVDDINDEDVLSWDKWVIMSHTVSKVDGVTPFFRVAMYGIHLNMVRKKRGVKGRTW